MNNPDSYFECYPNFQSDLDFGWLDTDYNPRNENKNMEKQFSILTPSNLNYKTYEEAEKEAKIKVGRNHQDYVIVKAIALANTPTPDVSVTKL